VRWTVALVLALGVLLGPSGPVTGHPLGNFSISHHAALRVNDADIELRYVLDLAEIPTFQELQAHPMTTDPADPGVRAYLARKADALAEGLILRVGERRLALVRLDTDIIFPPGAGGLPTLRIGVRYRAPLPAGVAAATLAYRDLNYPDRAGWKEIVAVPGPGITFLSSSVPARDRSQALSEYPGDLLDSPPQDVEATITFSRAPVVAATTAPAASDPGSAGPGSEPEAPRLRPGRQAPAGPRIADLVSATHARPGLVLLALAIAAGLGALHALEPGHGKTLVAAYLVGTRGTARHAVLLGLIVTLSHTAGVYLLGLVTLHASRHVVPERLYPWLGVASGLTIAALGIALFVRRLGGPMEHHAHGAGHRHDHVRHHHGPPDDRHPPAGHGHGGGDHGHGSHDHGHDDAHGHRAGDVGLRDLVALGVTGGIIPCPAALVVLLSAMSIGRVGFGLTLIVAFSAGLAAVLVVTGLLVVYARRFMARVHGEGPLVTRWLPLASSAAIAVLGLLITGQALQAAGIAVTRIS
jgi:ABC-type nickel/cobalt efflux system permease component RcnA